MYLLKVRRARKTGLNGKYNKKMGSIAVNNKLIGENVVVLLESEYKQLIWSLKRKEAVLIKIRKLAL